MGRVDIGGNVAPDEPDSHNHSFTNNKEKRSTTNKEELKHAASAEQSAAGGLLKQANNKREGKQYREAVQLY